MAQQIKLNSNFTPFLPNIIQYIRGYYKEVENLDLSENKLKRALKKKLSDQNNLYFTIEVNKNPAGFIHVYKLNAEYADLCLIYLEKAFRGKSYGTIAVTKLMQFLRKKGIQILRIEIEKNNLTSQHFFGRLGFKAKSNIYELNLD